MRSNTLPALALFLAAVLFAPTALPRRERHALRHWPVGDWTAVEPERNVSASFARDGTYRENWHGGIYVGSWERQPEGWVRVLCQREDGGDSPARFDLRYERERDCPVVLVGYNVRMVRRR